MPELPEVETIARCLRQGGRGADALPGKTIRSAGLSWQRTLATPAPAQFLATLPGLRLEQIGRRGKYLLLHLGTYTLLFHLRMSGDLLVLPAESPPSPHTRLAITFTDSTQLRFTDARKFGRAWLLADPSPVLAKLGPEPLSEGFTAEVFTTMLQRTRRQLKPLLLDQTFLAGLGNIYTDEALHLARLHPLRASHTLTLTEAHALWQAIRAVLDEGIRRQGASIDWVYRGGDFQNHFRAYQRTGLPCPACGAPIERLVVGQRGTHICPVCQPAP